MKDWFGCSIQECDDIAGRAKTAFKKHQNIDAVFFNQPLKLNAGPLTVEIPKEEVEHYVV